MPPDGLWIPITLWATFAQTLRNAAQRSLVYTAGTLGATLVRFLFGLPFAAAWFLAVLLVSAEAVPAVTPAFFAWVVEAAVCQMLATGLLLRVMSERNFAVGVAYSKTELVQVAVFGAAFLGDPTTLTTVVAIILATLGVFLISPPVSGRGRLRGLLEGWTSRTALFGVLSGTTFAIAAVGVRGAALELEDAPFTLSAAYVLIWVQAIQVLLLGGWLALRNRAVLAALLRSWPASTLAGFMGAAASAGWLTALAIEPVAHVRTLGLAELLFSLALAWRYFRERLGPPELIGVVLLSVGLALVTLAR